MNYVTEVNSFCVLCTIKAKKREQKNTVISDSAINYGRICGSFVITNLPSETSERRMCFLTSSRGRARVCSIIGAQMVMSINQSGWRTLPTKA